MKNNQKSVTILCTLSLLISSCAPVYLPPAANIPQFSEKGETQIATHVGTNGIDVQGAHSLTNSFALMGDISLNIAPSETNSHFYGEIAGGFFKPTENILRLSAYGGLGFGDSKGESSWTFNGTVITDQAAASLFRAFLQANVGVSSQVVDFSLATRAIYLRVSYKEKDNQPVPSDPVYGFLIEPVLSLGLGSSRIKAVAQVGLSLPLSQEIDFEYNPILMSIGLQFNLKKGD